MSAEFTPTAPVAQKPKLDGWSDEAILAMGVGTLAFLGLGLALGNPNRDFLQEVNDVVWTPKRPHHEHDLLIDERDRPPGYAGLATTIGVALGLGTIVAVVHRVKVS
jgi:hypothetical protein